MKFLESLLGIAQGLLMLHGIMFAGFQIQVEEMAQGNTAVLLIPAVDPFINDVSQPWTSDAMFDGMTPESFNRLIGIR